MIVKAGGEFFGFLVASFSRRRDDLGQWRAYADNGRGVAIGLAPHLFRVVDQTNTDLSEKVLVARVRYDRDKLASDMTDAIKMAISVLARHRGRGISEKDGVEFQRQLATLLSVPIFTLSMASKHRAYSNEKETRLLLVNDLAKLAPLIATRSRGSNLVPFH